MNVFSWHLLARIAIVLSSFQAMSATADPGVKADLERVAQLKILFGHQSVGSNILDGVRQLAHESGVQINIHEVSRADELKTSTFGHVAVAENGKPLMKLASFERSMTNAGQGPDIAFVKFCYVDFTSNTDVKSLFNEYRATIERLKSKHPSTTFLHVTAPLTEVEGGALSKIKRLIGRAPYGLAENMRRNEYNELLRKAYASVDPVFDLAQIESTATDGRRVTDDWKGQRIPVLAHEYSEDGGHLNALGRQRAARELVSKLAELASNRNRLKDNQ